MGSVWQKLIKSMKATVLPTLRNATAKRISIGLIFFVGLTTLLSMNLVPDRLDVKVGQPSPKTIKADKSIEFEDKLRTIEARNRAEKMVGKVHDENPGTLEQVISDISGTMSKVKEINKNQQLTVDQKAKQLQEAIDFQLNAGVYRSLVGFNPQTIQTIDVQTRVIVTKALKKGILEENLEQTKLSLVQEDVNALDIPEDAKVFIGALIENYLQPNYLYNAEATDKKIEEARDSVIPVRHVIQRGEKIIGEGEIATPSHIQKLEALGLLRAPVPISAVVGVALLVILAIAIIIIYLYRFRPDLYNNENIQVLIGLVVIVNIILAKTMMAIEIRPEWSGLLGYLIPVASVSMLLAILVDTKVALLVVAIMSSLLGIVTGNDLRYAMVALFSGLMAVYSVSKLSQRSDLAKAGLLYVSGTNIVAIIAAELITRGFSYSSIAIGIIFGLSNGIFSAILTIGLLPYLESAFGITSAVSLLELANPGQPLLKQLLVEAPGTYHHCILVGNLAEAAADAVGGDSLLVRVGAYYHDIGKLKRPYFFIENQFSSENPHDKLTPNLSTLIITSHTADGVELAKEHKMPKQVIDIIQQHHGTSLVSYFYNSALEADGNVNEEDFRYEGPKPQTKEAALVMMADSVEAAVRALQKPTPGRIEGSVRKVIKDKLRDGQLDECDLTFKDLDTIANAFVRVLSGIFHNRVEYPETVIHEIERRRAKNVALRKQSNGRGDRKQSDDTDTWSSGSGDSENGEQD